MHKHTKVVPVRDMTCVAALLSADAVLDQGDEVSAIVGDRNIRAWNFLERTKNGESVQKFKDIFDKEPHPLKNEWRCKNPDHVFAAAWVGIHNREFVHEINNSLQPSVIFRKGRATAIVDPRLEQRKQDEILMRIGE